MANSTQQLMEKMARRKVELERKNESNLWASIQRRAKRDGGRKTSISSWMADKYFGIGDYDCGEASPNQSSNH